MPSGLEREIKLRYDSVDEARKAILSIGAAPLRPRRLQRDSLLDTEEWKLVGQRAAIRVRTEPGGGCLTFKGAAELSTMKVREEIETPVEDPAALLSILERLGLRVWFRYEKYREEFAALDAVIAIDETPVGVFVELEGPEAGVQALAEALGRGPVDYVLDSYRTLFVDHCCRHGLAFGDMLFERA